MATTLSANTASSVSFSFQNVLTGNNVVDTGSYSLAKVFTNGTGANQAQYEIRAAGTIAASGTTTINLQSLTNQLTGATISLVGVKEFWFELQTTTTASSVSLGAAAANPWVGIVGSTTTTIPVLNGMKLEFTVATAAGIVVSSTSCQLKITNNDASNVATFRYLILGI